MTAVEIWMILATVGCGFGAMAIWLHSLSQHSRTGAEQWGAVKTRLDHLESEIRQLKTESHREHGIVHTRLDEVKRKVTDIDKRLVAVGVKLDTLRGD